MDADRTRTISDKTPPDSAGVTAGLLVLFSRAAIPDDGLYPARPELIVGRGPDCTVFLEDAGLSRFHAAVRFDGGTVSVRDAGSHNGTFRNGERIAGEVPLAPGDVLRCGETLLTPVPDLEAFGGWRRWGLTPPLVGGPAMRQVVREIEAFAGERLAVLITGESGTGKELVARELHRLSGRGGAFLAVSCATIRETLFEEPYGSGGTLFLDEISALSDATQAKLLRAIEEPAEVRVLAATNREVSELLERGKLRQDLYHRLRGALIHLPPIRERREDIPLLAQHLLGPAFTMCSALVLERLLLHDWPGNVRELDHVLREALARARGEGAERVEIRHLREELRTAAAPSDDFAAIREALVRCRGNVSRAAAELGMHRAQIYTMLRERGLQAESFR